MEIAEQIEQWKQKGCAEQEAVLIYSLKSSSVQEVERTFTIFTKAYEERGKVPGETFGTEEFVQLLLRTLREPPNVLVVELLLMSIKVLCRLDKNSVLVAECGGIPCVIEAMKKYKDQGVQQAGVSSILNLTVKNDKNRVKIVEEGGIKSIVRAMKRNKDHPGIQESSCAALSSLAFKNEANKNLITEAGGIEYILAAMNNLKHVVDVQTKACAALRNLASTNKNNQSLIGAQGGIVAILNAMSRFEDNVGLQQSAAAAIWNLSPADENRAIMRSQGGIHCIIKTMHRHQNNADIQESGCGALWNLAIDEEGRVAIASEGGIPVVLNAMKNHLNESGVQENACGALQNIAADANNRVIIANSKGVKRIVATMNRYMHNTDVLKNCCGALWNIGINERNKAIIAKSGGIECIIKAMNLHIKSRDVQRNASGALWNCTQNDLEKSKELSLQKGGLKCFINAMTVHTYDLESFTNSNNIQSDELSVQAHGLRFIWFMIQNNLTKEYVLTSQILRLTKQAVLAHTDNPAVQYYAKLIQDEIARHKNTKHTEKHNYLKSLEAGDKESLCLLAMSGEFCALQHLVSFMGDECIPIIEKNLFMTPISQMQVPISPQCLITPELLNITDLPKDVQWHVFHFLDGISLARCFRVCTLWNSLCRMDFLWKNQCKNFDFYLKLEINASDNTSWYQIFLDHCSVPLLEKLMIKCKKRRTEALAAIKLLQPSPHVISHSLPLFQQQMLLSPTSNQWPDPVNFYDAVYVWFVASKDCEQTAKLLELLKRPITLNHRAHITAVFTTITKLHLSEHCAMLDPLLVTMCTQHAMTDGTTLRHLYHLYGDTFIKQLIAALTELEWNQTDIDVIREFAVENELVELLEVVPHSLE